MVNASRKALWLRWLGLEILAGVVAVISLAAAFAVAFGTCADDGALDYGTIDDPDKRLAAVNYCRGASWIAWIHEAIGLLGDRRASARDGGNRRGGVIAPKEHHERHLHRLLRVRHPLRVGHRSRRAVRPVQRHREAATAS